MKVSQTLVLQLSLLIQGLDHSLAMVTELSRWDQQESYFSYLNQRGSVLFVGQIYLKCEVFLNLKTSIFPLKGNWLKIPFKIFPIALCYSCCNETLRRI